MTSKIAYFDNAATSFPKPEQVYAFADNFYRNAGGNSGRGHNALAESAGSIVSQAKANLRVLFNCPGREVVFTSSATDALNRVIFGLGLQEKDTVFITPFEHNAVTRPLNHLVETIGIQLEILSFDTRSFSPMMEDIKNQLEQNKPRLLVMTHASNVFGTIVPIFELASLAKEYDATVVVDMSQTAGLIPVDLTSTLIDYAIFAGHKTLYGPFGVGGFICSGSARLKPILFGGNGINSISQEMPHDIVQMTEVGSQNAYAIAGLKASTDWLLNEGIEKVFLKEKALHKRLFNLLSNYPNISVLGASNLEKSIGVTSVLFEGYSPSEAEMILGKLNVAVRSGLQCSPYAHRFAGTLPAGTVRFSVSALSQSQDFETLSDVLKYINEAY